MELIHIILMVVAVFGFFIFLDSDAGKNLNSWLDEVMPRALKRFLFAAFIGTVGVLNPGGFLIWVPFEKLCSGLGIDNAVAAYVITVLLLSILYARAKEDEKN